MPSSNQGWPEDFGFKLGGSGPSYILAVDEGSSAHLAGLQPGDQVLEIEGQDVSTLGAAAVSAIAQTQKNIPPSIGVVSRIQQVSEQSSTLIHCTFLAGFYYFAFVQKLFKQLCCLYYFYILLYKNNKCT